MGTWQEIVSFAIVIFLGIGFHEYAHCKVAELMGDPTPREMGRVTLNLFKHFDPAGTVMIILTSIVGFGIGWGKPAPVNANRMRNPRWGLFATVIAGPLCNIAQAVVWAGLLQLFLLFPHGTMSPTAGPGLFVLLCFIGIQLNLRLALFNMIPLGPLDGHWLIGLLMPQKAMNKWFMFNRQYGGILLIGIILVSQISGRAGSPSLLSLILEPPVDFMFRLLTRT